MRISPPPLLTPFSDGTNIPPRQWILWFQEATTYLSKNRGYGTTAERPTNNIGIGDTYFDTTIGMPIWWSGSIWVLSTGVAA